VVLGLQSSAAGVLTGVAATAAALVLLLAVLVGSHGRRRRGRGVLARAGDRLTDALKRPVALGVLDEVADVVRAGRYTQNLAAALRENSTQLKRMVADKIRDDPSTSRLYLLPFHERLIDQASDVALRMVLEILADPRTDELVSDILRDNLHQIRDAIRSRMP
jgi:hypothetical protein